MGYGVNQLDGLSRGIDLLLRRRQLLGFNGVGSPTSIGFRLVSRHGPRCYFCIYQYLNSPSVANSSF